MVRCAILGLLRERADYGYNLKRRFDERVGALRDLDVGHVYRTLRVLERSGHVVDLAPAVRADVLARLGAEEAAYTEAHLAWLARCRERLARSA